ncbi:MAG TPA: hypothetical protein VKY54_09590 [Kiloniellales bacterium]|jgi:signal transduction histidine kinase|nr:hypothetical protein [Kiloniellales bacterium]
MSQEDERRARAADRGPGRETYDATDARQGEIILRTRRRRMIFFGGLIALVLLGLLLRVCAGTA